MADAAGAREVTREEARKLIEGGAQLIDVRADHEWEAGRISGAKHVPLGELAARAGEMCRVYRPASRSAVLSACTRVAISTCAGTSRGSNRLPVIVSISSSVSVTSLSPVISSARCAFRPSSRSGGSGRRLVGYPAG